MTELIININDEGCGEEEWITRGKRGHSGSAEPKGKAIKQKEECFLCKHDERQKWKDNHLIRVW